MPSNSSQISRWNHISSQHILNCVAIELCVGKINLNMADAETLKEEPQEEEISESVKSEPDETSEETPNGVKMWVKKL